MLKQYIDDYEVSIQRAEYHLAELQLRIAEDGKFVGYRGSMIEMQVRSTFISMMLDYLYNQNPKTETERTKLETVLLNLNSLIQKNIC